MTITSCINASYCGWRMKSLINYSYTVWKAWQSLVPSLYGKLCFYWYSSKKTIKIKWLLQLVWLPWICRSIPLNDTNCKSCFQVYMKWNCSFIEAICWLMSHGFNWKWRCMEYPTQYPHHSCPLLIITNILPLNKVFYPNLWEENCSTLE